MKLRVVSVAALSFFLSFDTYAANESSEEVNKIFNPEIFSVSKKKESAFDTASATYVLSSEEIRRSGVTSVPEALRLVPGVQVARMNGNSWAISIRGFDRQFSNKLLVMVDGRVVYTQLFSGVFWDIQDYVLEDIDRIEVVRGPGGTIWGANAVNGVINIITKNAAQTQGAYVSQIVGNQDKSITEARYGGTTATKDNYRLYAKKAVRNGVENYNTKTDADDGYKQDRAGFRYDITSIRNHTISLRGDMFSGLAQNYFGAITSNSERNDKQSKGANLMLDWNVKASKKSDFALQTYFDYDNFHLPFLQRSARTFDVDFQHFYNFTRDNQLIWGLGYRQIADKIGQSAVPTATGAMVVPISYTPNRRNDEIYSAFIQEKFALIADKAYLTLGSKFMINDYTGFEYQPSAKFMFYPKRNQTLWASVSRAVRTPTRGENDINLKADSKGYITDTTASYGNSTFASEQLLAYELGYRVKPSHSTMFDATAFYNDYTKLRTVESSPNGPTAENLGYGESFGFEVSGKWQVTDKWRLESSYDYLKMNLYVSPASIDDTTSIVAHSDGLRAAEGMSPQNQFRIKSFYNITPKVEFDNILYYVDKLKTGGTTATGGSDDRLSAMPSYFRYDTRIGYLPTRNLELSVGIQNLLDHRHSEFKRATYNYRTDFGRTYYFKISWRY